MARFECPHCITPVDAPGELAGKTMQCRHCGHPFTAILAAAPAIARPTPREELVLGEADEESSVDTRSPEFNELPGHRAFMEREGATLQRVGSILCGVFCAFGFVATIGSQPYSIWTAWHYLTLLLTVGVWTWWLCRYAAKWLPFLNGWGWLIVYCLPVVVAFCWGWFDSFETRWKEDGISFTDSHKRWSGRHFYRRMHTHTKDVGSTFADGPMSASGKPHGPWEFSEWGEAGINNNRKWYWYGDEISEGEWHLRNR